MEHTTEQQRAAFSDRLVRELKRIGQPVDSPTQIARAFNRRFAGEPVKAQAVRKWLFAEGLPGQLKLLALAKWLGVSAQWLRYGVGSKIESSSPLSEQQTRLVLLSREDARIIPLVDKLVRLSPRDIRLVENMVQLMSESNEK
ncbi:MAG: hypothetical protein WCI39_00340 [Gallionellaceae bacterium]